MDESCDPVGDFVCKVWTACAEIYEAAECVALEYPEAAWTVMVSAETFERNALMQLGDVIRDTQNRTDA